MTSMVGGAAVQDPQAQVITSALEGIIKEEFNSSMATLNTMATAAGPGFNLAPVLLRASDPDTASPCRGEDSVVPVLPCR